MEFHQFCSRKSPQNEPQRRVGRPPFFDTCLMKFLRLFGIQCKSDKAKNDKKKTLKSDILSFAAKYVIKVDIVKNTFLEKQCENIKSYKHNFNFRGLICVKVPIGHQAASTEKSAQKTSPKREKKRLIPGTPCFLDSNGHGLQDDFD